MIIKVKTNKDVYFRQMLELISSIPPVNGLSNREKELLSIMMRFNWKNRDLNGIEKEEAVTGKAMRHIAAEEIGIKVHTVRTLLSSLKRKGFIDEKGLAPWLGKFKYGENFEFKFKEE